MSDILHVIGVFKAVPGKENALRDVLTALVAPTRSETDNLSYVVIQGADNATDFFTVETWKSPAGLAEHMKKPYVAEALAKSKDLLAKAPSIVSAHEVHA